MKTILSLVTVFAIYCGQAFGAARPNVILFLVDDMGWVDCGAYGSKYYETPNMDRFATRAMRFTDAYAQPLCSPTRASLLTGKYSARHGITSATGHLPPQPAGYKFLPDTAPPNQPMCVPESKNFMEPSEYTLAEALHDAGYRTAHIGKWHLGLVPEYWPEKQGFDFAFHCHPDPGPPGNYFSPYGVKPDGVPKGQSRVGTITDGPPGEYIVDRLTDEAIKFIESNRERPFFLNLWQYGVHGPWGHKEEYTKAFMSKKDPRGVQGNPIMASMLKSVDESFGRILDALDRLNLTENTIIIFNSDNGGNTHSNLSELPKTAKAEKNKGTQLADWRKWAGDQPPTINTPLRDGKASLYEGGTRVPLMWAWAGHIKPGTLSDAVVGHVDLYPTVLDLVGLPSPAQQKIDGISYAGVLTKSEPLKRTAFFNYFPHAGTGRAGGVWARSGDWKLIRWFGMPAGNPQRYELYNLREDLSETKNLAEAQPARVKELDSLIDGFLADTGATVPKPNPAYRGTAATPPVRKGDGAALNGWVPKACTAETHDGALVVTGNGKAPFLGLTNLKHPGPVTVRLRTKSGGGAGKIQWRTAGQDTFPDSGQITEFNLPAGKDWSETTIELPVTGSLLHLRLYLPAQRQPVEMDWAEIKSAGEKIQRWDFN